MRMILAVILLTACTESKRGSLEDGRILGIGDSIFEWNTGDGSVIEVIGEVLEQPAYNNAISGSMISTDDEWSIPNQWIEGDWDWVVLDGGANDLNEHCQCGECASVHDEIETAYVNLISTLRTQNVNVVIWGYYVFPEESEEFGICNDNVNVLSEMQQTLAATDTGVLWVDGREQINGEDLSYFDDDLIHPSVSGSKLIGEQIARAIQVVGK